MVHQSAAVMQSAVEAHGAAADRDAERLRTLGMRERGILIESACAAAAAIQSSRLAAGLPAVEPAPWPPSTWEFLRKHAARVRT
jgi:hypothetical protein